MIRGNRNQLANVHNQFQGTAKKVLFGVVQDCSGAQQQLTLSTNVSV